MASNDINMVQWVHIFKLIGINLVLTNMALLAINFASGSYSTHG